MNEQRRNLLRGLSGAVVLSTLPSTGHAHEYYANGFTVVHPWALPTAPGATTAAVWVRFEDITENDRLIAAHTMLAKRVELHDAPAATGSGAVLDSIPLVAPGPVVLAPGGMHLLMIDLATPLQELRSYPLTFVFERSGTIETMLSMGGD